ncbi:hypothetical protein [Aeoliella mucimassa]|uniref:Type 4 fimbrial biogenesis protein PilX N-terminal domain-containing protein n=1 Tax=Aeoliella mucimassa TaxID=2527972 RepID=A0A518AQY9_9BACT|nr:hypothetical protein [Aeoliella mucimassa]QDU57126.1 hypothetical protein Pan181_33400 [Aeoliella mucimassa]
MIHLYDNQRKRRRHDQRGMALLLCLFVVFIVSSLILNVITTETLQYSVARNVHDYQRAIYLANAGVHHVCAELEADNAWRGTVTDGSYPANNTYSATASDGTDGDVDIVSTGVSGNVTRTVEATVEL